MTTRNILVHQSTLARTMGAKLTVDRIESHWG